MSNFAIQNSNMDPYVTSTGSSNEVSIGNQLKGTGVNNNGTTSTTNSTANSAIRTQDEIDKAILNVIKNYEISLEEAKTLISLKSKYDTLTLENADTNKFNKILMCLSNALKDSVVNGKLDTKKLQRVFAGYKYYTMNQQTANMSFNDARKKIQENEKKSLVDFIKEKSPELKDKPKEQITASDLKEAIKKELKENFTPEKIQEMKKAPAQAKSFLSNVFSYALENCTPEEKSMLFEAFVMLIQDKDMAEFVPLFATQMCEEYKNNPEKLNKFVKEVLPATLSNLGFSPEKIAKIIALTEKGISPEALLNLINGSLEFLKSVDPNDIPELKVILSKQQSGDLNFTTREKELIAKYQNEINTIVGIYANAIGNTEIPDKVREALDKLAQSLKDSGMGSIVYKNMEILYKLNPDIFNNLSEDDFAKLINKITNNQYSEAVGDTNPEHLYKEETSGSTTSSGDFGFPQSTPNDTIVNSYWNTQDLLRTLYGGDEVPKNNKLESILFAKQIDAVTSPKEKYSSMKNLTAQDIYDGLANNYIKIYDVLDNYKDLTQSAKDFVNGILEKMPPAVQSYVLDGIGGHEVLDIIKHTKISPEDLKGVVLDYNSRKELEGLEDEKIVFNK